MVWTILRPGGFASNALAWVPMIKELNAVHAPFGDVALPAVDPLDIAEIAAATGRPLEFVELTPEEARGQMSAPGKANSMPPAVVEGTLAILGHPTADEQAVSPHVEEVLGRPARGFGEWARRSAAAYGA